MMACTSTSVVLPEARVPTSVGIYLPLYRLAILPLPLLWSR